MRVNYSMVPNGTLVHLLNDTGTGAQTVALDYWYLLLFTFVFGTIFGNGLVITAITRRKKLQTNATNQIIASMALVDLLLSITVMPVAVIDGINGGYWRMGLAMCNLWITFDVYLCTASIFHLMVIALERLCAVKFPRFYHYTSQKQKTLLVFKLMVCWLGSFVIALGIFILGWTDPDNVLANGGRACTMTNLTYIITSCLVSYILPLATILASYLITAFALKKRRPRPTNPGKRQLLGCTKSGSASFREETVALSSTSSSNNGGHQQPAAATEARLQQESSSDRLENGGASTELHSLSNPPQPEAVSTIGGGGSGKLLQPSAFNERKNAVKIRREEKAMRIIWGVVVVFTICWTPFFTFHMTSALCPVCAEAIPTEAFLAAVWLGYINSMLNPLIYTICNSQFRKVFIELLTRSKNGKKSSNIR